ncbi:response regulator transcription factor [Streptomyces sp. BH-SS-21]|uniref:Response regulator transcription factor n=1 Tax=Streptomyces liliiviolaceus TaxID=2823109 RepID=A0A941BA94_9ACTN|nr:response regulator [Streptomyces liliiviolaceus]MBQ0852522.1 response regulator transcription factor [Streptomyces liliiviolaceus]
MGNPVAVTSGSLSVAVVDDHPVVIEGIQAWLSQEPRISVRHTGEAVDVRPGAVDVLILDLNLHGRLVVDDIATLAAAGQRVIAFSQFTEQRVVLESLEAGACEFVAKNEGRAHLVNAVLAAAGDRPYVTPTAAGVLVGDRGASRPRLSSQERTALLWWFQSMSKASVARRMGVSVHTVDIYIRRARVKYAQVGRTAPTKADMLARAIEDGLVTPDDITGYESAAFNEH